jgi:hypothetical protein
MVGSAEELETDVVHALLRRKRVLVIVDPIVSIALSVWLFGERFTADAGVLAIAAVAFAVMCAAVVLLTQTAPATMKADTGNDKEGSGQHGAAGSSDQQARR